MNKIFYYIREYRTFIEPSSVYKNTFLEVTRLVRLATVCLIIDGKKVVRGFAVCSRQDQFCRRIGRAIAEGRALFAIQHRVSMNYMRWPVHRPAGSEHLVFKSDYDPGLTDFERKLIGRVMRHEQQTESEREKDAA